MQGCVGVWCRAPAIISQREVVHPGQVGSPVCLLSKESKLLQVTSFPYLYFMQHLADSLESACFYPHTSTLNTFTKFMAKS